jgi:hypothetical protein
VPTVLVIGLAIYCLIDCFQSSNETVRNLPKLVWALLIVLLPLFGSIGWLVAGRPAGNPRPGSGGPRVGLRDRTTTLTSSGVSADRLAPALSPFFSRLRRL